MFLLHKFSFVSVSLKRFPMLLLLCFIWSVLLCLLLFLLLRTFFPQFLHSRHFFPLDFFFVRASLSLTVF